MKLTPEILRKLGFRGEGRSLSNTPAYRLEVPKGEEGYYCYGQFQLVLGDYPDSNPNCGILSLYQPEVKDAHVLSDDSEQKLDYILEDHGEYKVGYIYDTFSEDITPIANHVNTLERLNAIYTALTGNPPLELPNK